MHAKTEDKLDFEEDVTGRVSTIDRVVSWWEDSKKSVERICVYK